MAGSTKKIVKRSIAAILFFGVCFGIWFYGPLVYGLWKQGFFSKAPDPHRYEGTSRENLRLMEVALMGYQDSEGQFPDGDGWMDAIANRIHTDDLKKGEAQKKLIYPGYLDQPGKYGYAFNDALSGKYLGDVKDKNTILIFESTTTERNAHGDPAKIRRPGGLAITVSGQVIH